MRRPTSSDSPPWSSRSSAFATRPRAYAGALDALNERLMQDVQASGEAFLTQTTLRGRFALRACVLHYATTEADVAALVDVVRETGARLASTGPSIPLEHGEEQEHRMS